MLLDQIEEMKLEINKSSMPIAEDIHSDFTKLFSENLNKDNVPPFMKLFWEEQQKYLYSSRTGVRYHPKIIRYCLNLVAKSPLYDEIRYNESQSTGFIILPSRRRLRPRDYKNYIKHHC